MTKQDIEKWKRMAKQADPYVGVGDILTNGELLELIKLAERGKKIAQS